MNDLKMVDLLSGIFIIVFIGLVITLLGLMRAISKRSTFLKEMKGIQISMRELLSGMHALRVNLQQNQILNHEPFLSRLKALDVELSWLESEFNTLRDRYIQVQEKIDRWEKIDKLNYLLTLLPWSDYNRLIPYTTSFAPKIIVLNDYLAKALLHTREIADLGWEISSQIRGCSEKLNDCNRVHQALCEKNVRGSNIEEAKLTIERLSQKINSIPKELLTNTKEEIINQIEYATICQAYEIYQEINPVIDSLHLRLYQWWNEYQQAWRTINSALSTLTNTSVVIQESSEKIAMGNLMDNLRTIQSIGNILNDTLNRVEIESLPDMTQEAGRIYQLALETADTVKMARRNQSILEPLLEQIGAGVVQLEDQINVLGKHSTFPVAWDKSGTRFYSIKERQKEIVVKDKLRSPDEIQSHLTIALSLYKEIIELSSQIKPVASIHEALVKISQTDEINQGLYWCQEAKRILESAEMYNPANFPKNLSVQYLNSEMENIQGKHQSLINKLFSNPIFESSLRALLDEMRTLFDSYSMIREQVNEVKSYLTVFRDDINQTRQTLQTIQPLINQMESIVRSNPLLLQQGAEKEIERLRKNLDTCTTKINDLSTGTIRNKQMAAATVERRVEVACQRWNQYIEKNIGMISSDLREKVNSLGKMANLDDAIILQARDLLYQIDRGTGEASPASAKTLSYANPVIYLKVKNDLWQNLLAASGEIDEMIYNPISEAYQAAMTQKELATKQLFAAAEQIPEKRAWPPTSIILPMLSANLSAIDVVWNKNISQPMRAIWWVKRFGEIWIKYQEFSHSVNTAVETCDRERQKIIELEQQLDIIEQKWSSLEQQMAENHVATARIRALKKDIEQQYKQIRRRWQFSSSLPGVGPTYDEIKNSLLELVERFQRAKVIVSEAGGDKIEMNILGQHISETE